MVAPPSLSVGIVTYRTQPRLLSRALLSLSAAAAQARASLLLGEMDVFVIDNGPPDARGAVEEALREWPAGAGRIERVAGQGNVGYARGNNLVLGRLASDYHLVMNPDVELDANALAAALAVLASHGDVGLVAPDVRGDDGVRQYLCKRYPSVWLLFLRGFAPQSLRRRFARALSDYEMRELVEAQQMAPVPLASGCFMLLRTAIFRRLDGFDPRYFLYFEDYDLSLRVGRQAAVAYVPQARIVHHGGEAARKGPRHVAWFVRSAWRFFATHGWKIA